MDLVEEETVHIRSQPVFFNNTGVDADHLTKPSNWSMADNEEHTIGMVPSNSVPYEGFVTRSNNYCFLRLHRDGKDVSFFFKCDALAEEKVYFRELLDECPYPLVTPPSPPAEEVCFLYAKRAATNVSKLFDVVGNKAEGVLDCYIKVIETITPGNLESMCTREAVTAEWKAITATDLRQLAEGNVATSTDENGVTHYEYSPSNNTTTIEAK